MKKFSLLALAAAGLLLGACSSDKDVVDSTTPSWNGNGDGFISLSIKLPTTPTTRALNDQYDDGLAAEYKVTDAALLLFAGADEANAKCISAQQLTLPFERTDNDADNDNLTSSYQITAEVLGTIGASDKLYALACLNYKNIINIASGAATINSTAVVGKKLSELMDAAYEVAGNEDFYIKSGASSKNYFFMTNAPLQHADATAKASAPTAEQVKTLALLDKTKIKRTKAEAAEDPAGDIYVERAVAKATLNCTISGSGAATLPGTVSGTSTPLAISKVEWVIDNKEPKSFVVRNMGDLAYIAYSSEAFATPYYRMVGDVKMGKTATLHNYDADIYRTYWCIDPQYNATATGMVRSDNESGVTRWGATGEDNPQYCNENTFNVANQLYKNTTRAILKVTPTNTDDFYTVNGGEERYSQTAAESYLLEGLVDNADVIAAFKAVTKAGKSFAILPSYFTVTYADDASTGRHTIKTVSFNTTAFASYVDASDATKPLSGNPSISDFNTIISSVNDNVKVLKYTNGIVYYEARFEHFANTTYEKGLGTYNEANAKADGDLAPWNCWEPTGKKPSATDAYPAGTSKTAEENYLGRWGMVRNNWYDVTVTAFNKIGSPVDPSGNVENPDYPDDNVKEYISVKIHVLSWAKRTQQWSF